MEDESVFDHDLDFSFTSSTSTTATDFTFATSSARSSLTLSFNESRLSTNTIAAVDTNSSGKCDQYWSSIKAAKRLSLDGKLHLRHLKLVRHLGTGNLGRVYLCQIRDCKNLNFALKVVDRDSLTSKKLTHVQMEAEVLSMLDHPFLPTLYARIEASHYTCLLMDYASNGDLHSLLAKQPCNRLPLEAVRFFAAEVLIALEYLHAIGVVYRDLKPENILLREDGHIMLSDFDLCFKANVIPTLQMTRVKRRTKKTKSTGCLCLSSSQLNYTDQWKEEIVAEFVAEPTTAYSASCVGTHEYLAPELVSGNGHGNGVDWWAFGILIYELLYGKTPFKGGNKEETLRNIGSTRQVKFRVEEREDRGMALAKDLIEKLLVKDPRKRLGCVKGATDIKRHPFFMGINWALIRNYKSPDVSGLVKKGSRVFRVTNGRKRRPWWKELSNYFTKNKCSYQLKRLGSSNIRRYYHYVDDVV